MIDKKQMVSFKPKPKLINTVKNQFIPWYFKAFNKKITSTQVVERGGSSSSSGRPQQT